jgi:hypothetical protein
MIFFGRLGNFKHLKDTGLVPLAKDRLDVLPARPLLRVRFTSSNINQPLITGFYVPLMYMCHLVCDGLLPKKRFKESRGKSCCGDTQHGIWDFADVKTLASSSSKIMIVRH